MQWYISSIRESQEVLVYISRMRELLKSLRYVGIDLKAHMDSNAWINLNTMGILAPQKTIYVFMKGKG